MAFGAIRLQVSAAPTDVQGGEYWPVAGSSQADRSRGTVNVRFAGGLRGLNPCASVLATGA